MRQKIGILGAGQWGKALVACLENEGVGPVIHIWTRGQNLCQMISEVDGVILALPAQEVRHVWAQIKVAPGFCWIASKGVEKITGLFLSEVIDTLCPCPLGYFGGPNLAQEIVLGKGCGITLASQEDWLLKKGLSMFTKNTFALETTKDLIGLQALGVLKNVFSIGYGLLDQNEAGKNMLATFFVLALQEMQSLLEALGGKKDSVFTFGGIGDFLVSAHHGRNALYGKVFGTQEAFQELAEGVGSLQGLTSCLERRGKKLENYRLVWGISEILKNRMPKEAWPLWILNGMQ